MKKKTLLFLLFVLCFFGLTACEPKTYTVTFNKVTVTEVEAEDEDAEPTYTYDVAVLGTEKVQKGNAISGFITAEDGTTYIAYKFYTAKEVNLDSTEVYDKNTAVMKKLTLYVTADDIAVYVGLASGTGYTLNYATTVFPTTWNSHVYETATDATIMDYVSVGFYSFDYNENKDGFVWVPEMAAGEPVDVTDRYATENNKWGLTEDDTARAWEITIRNDMKWDDGTPINANSFVESYKRLLNPLAKNGRADDYTYSGSFVIHNARNYVYQDSIATNEACSGPYSLLSQVKTAGYVPNLDLDVCNRVFKEEWIGGTLELLMGEGYYEAYIVHYFTIFTGEGEDRTPVLDDDGNPVTFFGKYNVVEAENGLIPVTDEMIEDYSNCDNWDPNADVELCKLTSIPEYVYPIMSFEDVGVFSTGDYKIVYIIDEPLQGFYLKYALSAPLVKIDLYDSCDNIGADGKLPDGVAYTTTYCTDAATTPSFGPYKLVEYQLDKYFKLVKNDQWYGYKDEVNEGLYQTTAIVYTMAESSSTRLQMFLAGQLDSYGLTSDDMDEYQTSDYTYFTDEESTWFLAFNPSQEKYHDAEYEYTTGEDKKPVKGDHMKIDKEILSIVEFRQALSFALDRAAFNLACIPTCNVGKAILSPMIVSNPDEGTMYRNTDAAKNAIVEFWGVADEIGADKLYATIDEAIDSITGYNPDLAKRLFDEAYDKAKEFGYIADDEVVEILIGTPNLTSGVYNKGYDFLVNCYTEAVKGTKLEGKLTFKRDGTLGNSFGDYLRDNKVDMLFFVGFSGSALNPYNLINAYTTYDGRYNVNTDYYDIMSNIKLPAGYVEGTDSTELVEYSASIGAWTDSLEGKKISLVRVSDNTPFQNISFGTNVDFAIRELVLAGIEVGALRQYEMIPTSYDSSATLKGMKVNYYTEEYVFGMGRGGIRYMTFNYNDSEWAAFVAANNGILNYKASAE